MKTGGNGILRQQKGNVIIYNAAYSEHSSFKELLSFVEHFRPKKLIPTVGGRNATEIREMHRLLGHTDSV